MTWTAPEFNGGATITSYVIRFKQADGGFSTLLASCDGSNSVIRSALTCTVPSVSFTQAPFSLPWGSLVYATVTAVNNIGSSLTSLEGSGAKILAIPQAPLNLQNRPAITSATQIGLIWDSIPEIDCGGSPVIDYSIFMAIGSGQYSTLETGVTITTYIAIDLAQGTTYSFKIQSRNIFGYSLDSLSVSILAAQVPDQPLPPTSSLSGTSLTISWTAPDNRGKVIDSYRIRILQSDLSTYSLELNDCDGSKASIVSQTSCVIDVLILRSAPFSLPWGS